MKSNLKLLSEVFVLLFVVGCAASFLLPEEKEQTFSHEVQMKKENIRTKVAQFINEKFVSGKSFTKSSEEDSISVSGIFEIDNASLVTRMWTIYMELTLLVNYTDNQYNTKYIVKRVIYEDRNSFNLAEEAWGNYKEEINKTIKDMDTNLFRYLTKKNDKFNF